MTPRALASALPPRAAAALQMAQQFDPSCDAASALLAAHDHPTDSPERLARRIRAAARRDRRAGGAHGPARFAGLANLDQPGGDDPCALLEACQAVAGLVGVAEAMAQREPASDTRLLAERDGCTRRRVQQCNARRRRLEEEGQGVLL